MDKKDFNCLIGGVVYDHITNEGFNVIPPDKIRKMDSEVLKNIENYLSTSPHVDLEHDDIAIATHADIAMELADRMHLKPEEEKLLSRVSEKVKKLLK